MMGVPLAFTPCRPFVLCPRKGVELELSAGKRLVLGPADGLFTVQSHGLTHQSEASSPPPQHPPFSREGGAVSRKFLSAAGFTRAVPW